MTNLEKALTLCRSGYQRQYVRGLARASGADLHGATRNYSARYKTSQENIEARLTAANIP